MLVNARRFTILVALAGIAALLLRWLRQWAGDPPERRASHKEAIEPPELVERYSRCMGTLPMRLTRASLARYVTASPHWRILDVGCGPGWFPLEIAAYLPDAVIVGADLSHPMTVVAARHAQAADQADSVVFTQARGEVLPFADGAFDCVVSTLALHHWQDPVAVLKELQRVAQPAGRIIVFDIRRDMHPWLWTALKVGQTFGERLQLCENDEPSASISASYTPSELQRLALQAGWERVQIRTKLGWLMLERLPKETTPFPVPPAPRRKRNGTR